MTEYEIAISKALDIAREHGFPHCRPLDCSTLEFMEAVRDMCSADRCGQYGRNWTCPPACGSLETTRKRAAKYSWGILVQTVGNLEDDFDYETMEASAGIHREHFQVLVDRLRLDWPELLAMGAGACTYCKACTYPDLPCRFPDKAIISMEAFGLFVSQVCERNGMAYNHGPLSVTYTSCVLLEDLAFVNKS